MPLVPALLLGSLALAAWWRQRLPPPRPAGPLAAAAGFHHPTRRFLGREVDAGEPLTAHRRGHRLTMTEHTRPTGPGDADYTLQVSASLRHPPPADLTAWLARHPSVEARLQAASQGIYIDWAADRASREAHFTWGDPRSFDWTGPRLEACLEALVDLATALDAR